MRDESMDIEETWPTAKGLNAEFDAINAEQMIERAMAYNSVAATIHDERTEYTAPVVTLLTVKEAIAVWSREDRQELYEYLNRVYQVRMR